MKGAEGKKGKGIRLVVAITIIAMALMLAYRLNGTKKQVEERAVELAQSYGKMYGYSDGANGNPRKREFENPFLPENREALTKMVSEVAEEELPLKTKMLDFDTKNNMEAFDKYFVESYNEGYDEGQRESSLSENTNP